MRQWKGSVLKLIWHDLLLFGLAYLFLTLIYRQVLCDYEDAKEGFEIFCIYCSRYENLFGKSNKKI